MAPVEPGLASASERPAATSSRRAHDRGLRPRADRANRLLVVADHLDRVDDLDLVRGEAGEGRGGAEDPNCDVVGGRHADALGDGIDPGFGAERVEGDRDRVAGVARRTRRRSPHLLPLWASAQLGRGIVGGDDLAAGVGPAGRADAMRQPRAVALRALVEAGSRNGIVGATLVATGAGLTLLRDGHEAGNRSDRDREGGPTPNLGGSPTPWCAQVTQVPGVSRGARGASRSGGPAHARGRGPRDRRR